MSGHYEAPIREPLIIGHKTYHDITEDIARPIEGTSRKTMVGFLLDSFNSIHLRIWLYRLHHWYRYRCMGT